MRWTQVVSHDGDAIADGKVVWAWRPDAGAKRVKDVFMRDGDNKARSHRGATVLT
jgi:hypothetical protein